MSVHPGIMTLVLIHTKDNQQHSLKLFPQTFIEELFVLQNVLAICKILNQKVDFLAINAGKWPNIYKP